MLYHALLCSSNTKNTVLVAKYMTKTITDHMWYKGSWLAVERLFLGYPRSLLSKFYFEQQIHTAQSLELIYKILTGKY